MKAIYLWVMLLSIVNVTFVGNDEQVLKRNNSKKEMSSIPSSLILDVCGCEEGDVSLTPLNLSFLESRKRSCSSDSIRSHPVSPPSLISSILSSLSKR